MDPLGLIAIGLTFLIARKQLMGKSSDVVVGTGTQRTGSLTDLLQGTEPDPIPSVNSFPPSAFDLPPEPSLTDFLAAIEANPASVVTLSPEGQPTPTPLGSSAYTNADTVASAQSLAPGGEDILSFLGVSA